MQGEVDKALDLKLFSYIICYEQNNKGSLFLDPLGSNKHYQGLNKIDHQ